MTKNFTIIYALIMLSVFSIQGFAEHDHDVIIGLDTTVTPYQLTLANTLELETFELEYNKTLGIYYGGQACWIPEEGPLHVMQPYGDGTVPEGIYQLELAAVTMPEALIAFNAENLSQILNGNNFALDDWHWEESEGWHFHNHIGWGLNPALVEIGQTITASFQLTDTTGQYADSDIFTLSFIAVPEPTGFVLLALGAAVLRRKRNPKRA